MDSSHHDAPHLKALKHRAQHNDTQAQFKLAGLYFKGQGVKQNPQQAITWLETAARLGHTQARAHIALLYLIRKGAQINTNATPHQLLYRRYIQQQSSTHSSF